MRMFSLFLLVLCIGIFSIEIAKTQNTTTLVNVGVVLDMDTLVGKMGLTCISLALSDFYASHSYYKTRLVLNTRDSKGDVLGAAAAALDLLKNVEVKAIIGPSTSMQANFLVDLGDKAHVPVISFSATSPSLSRIQSPYFVRSSYNDSSQVKAISAVVQAFKWREVVPIYIDNEFGEGIIPFLTKALQQVGTRVPYWSSIMPSATDDQIVAELNKLTAMQTRVFVVHMSPVFGSRFFTKAKEVGMMSEGYIWIITDGLTNFLSSLDPSVIDSIQGVLGVTPHIPQTKELQNFDIRYKRKFQQEYPDVLNAEVNVFGLWAYDAAIALAMAVEKIGPKGIAFQKQNISGNSTDLETFGVSRTGLDLLKELLNTTFRGLGGSYHIVDGQLQSSTYQIVNVFGNGWKGVGFWTAEKGIIRALNLGNTVSNSTSESRLGTIMWPGDTTDPPKGWMVPTKGKKMRIGVPVKDGFDKLVKVRSYPGSYVMSVTGYCTTVFDAVMAALPYPAPYEYIPFAMPNGDSAGTYDDLVYQVYLGNFDAVVGDVTINANRSLFVDFTLPYTASGISMVVPMKEKRGKDAWVFLKPLTGDLWITILCSFAFIGFVVWVLEHRINEDFRGPPSEQIGTIFWFSFSTMVFAHKEKVQSNLARFVVIMWLFVVIVLTQSYTASLTTMLTVQQLQPTITDVRKLIEKREYVGYQQGSFVYGILKRMGFEESKLRAYNTEEECDELLSKGGGSGGIAAAFDEVPYVKLLVSKYCSKYSMIEPTYRTDGFGFVIPMGSFLGHDISKAILNVTESEQMVEIERAWFGTKAGCPDPGSPDSIYKISLESFWGLFLVAGVACFSSLAIFLALFLYNHIHIMRMSHPQASIWTKIVAMARVFNQRDIAAFAAREKREKGGGGGGGDITNNGVVDGAIGSDNVTVNDNSPPRNSSSSDNSDVEVASPVTQEPTS